MRDSDYLRTDEPATAEYVLAVLRDQHRRLFEEDRFDLTFESTVADWRDAWDLVGWRDLGHAWNHCLSIDCSDAEWKQVLEPAGKKRLAGVCELIARHTTRPRIRPAGFLGATCVTAGAFLAIRSLLRQAGANADAIAPSTPLALHARRHSEVFLGPISRLAPGALPAVRIKTPVYDAAFWLRIAGGLSMVAGSFADWPFVTIGGCLVFVLAWAAGGIAARWVLPASVEFPGLETFRDLARVIADRESA